MENIDDFVDTIDAEPSVDIALDAAQFAAGPFDDADADGTDLVTPTAPIAFVPDAVQSFLISLHRAVRGRLVSEIYHLYESTFNRLTDRFFKSSPWPRPDIVQSITGGGAFLILVLLPFPFFRCSSLRVDKVFLVLYKELYFRHIYSRLQPTLDQRFESWQNYLDLFNLFLGTA
jgi:translation initiation factor 3 subunit L